MILIDNNNSDNCYELDLVNSGDCCCNCIHHKSLFDERVGSVGYVCDLFVELNEPNSTYISSKLHGLCEMHERVT